MYEISYSDKYEKDLNITEIAKRLRAEIRITVKADKLPKCKYSVRISRFSGGQSLSVTVSDTPFPVHNRRYLELEHQINYGFHNRQEVNDLYAKKNVMQRWTQEAIDLIKTLEVMADQWNYDGSETQVDYFNVNYYKNVNYDAYDEWAQWTEEIKQAIQGVIE